MNGEYDSQNKIHRSINVNFFPSIFEYFVFRSLKRKKIKISMGQSQSVKAPETEAEELSYLTGLEICQIDKLYERLKLNSNVKMSRPAVFFFDLIG